MIIGNPIMLGGGGGGLDPSKPLIHVNAPLGSTVDFTLSSVIVATIPPAKAFPNSDGKTAEYYYSAPSNGTYSVNATDSTGKSKSETVVVSENKQYNLTIGYLVPNTYQEVEYIQSSRTQKIDTGVPSRVLLRAEIDFQLISNNNASETILASDNNTLTQATYLGCNWRSGYSGWYIGYNGSWIDIRNRANLDRHNIVVDLRSGVQTLTEDGAPFYLGQSVFSTTTAVETLKMFGVTRNGGEYGAFKLFSCKIWDYNSNGDMIRCFVPVYRKSDSEPGLWDAVAKTFYTNIGTGSFSVGPDVN